MAYVVGLTGGIGSGKSAAADKFAALGAVIVDTDAIAHELTRPGGAAIEDVRRLFGDSAITAEGAMDRARIRELVFADSSAKQKLEALLHPMIRAESQRQIAAVEDAPYVVHVIPLLVESGDYRSRVHRVLVVDCAEEIQIERVRNRSGLTVEAVQRIVAAQVPRAKRLAAADDVIDNGGLLNALEPQVRRLDGLYRSLARKSA